MGHHYQASYVDTSKPRILVVGCASIDTVHIEIDEARSTFETMGGAGLYTALAARAAGATVTLYAPRTDSLPEKFKRVPEVINWIGPLVEPDEMPALEIVHHGGGRATLINARWGAEERLAPAGLPGSLHAYAGAHIAALSSAARQSAFALVCKERGVPVLSAGTYARLVYGDRQGVSELLARCNYFFMNANEACGMFGSASDTPLLDEKIVFVTDGDRGADIFTRRQTMHVEAVPSQELDPTGAGDTFCGATLAGILSGKTLEAATHHASELAALCITKPGPEAVLERIP